MLLGLRLIPSPGSFVQSVGEALRVLSDRAFNHGVILLVRFIQIVILFAVVFIFTLEEHQSSGIQCLFNSDFVLMF